MNKEDLLLLILALALLLAMILTYIFRQERSMHGYGAENCNPGPCSVSCFSCKDNKDEIVSSFT